MKLYDIQKIQNNFYLIFENYAEDSSLVLGLIIGDDQSVLVDSGMGVFGEELRDIVLNLTDKPIINILTHGHPDHIGGSVLFDNVYMNERDRDQIPRLAKDKRLKDVKMFSHNNPEVMAYAEEHCLDYSGFHYENIDDGDKINIGGTELEIIKLPGHSLGSIAVYNRKDNYAMVGDAFSNRVPASSIRSIDMFNDMADSIHNFLNMVPKDVKMYGGHWKDPIEMTLVMDEMHAAREIAKNLVQQDEEVYLPISPVPNQKKHVYGSVAITYDPLILETDE